MPIYLVRCGRCEAQTEIYRTFKTMDDLPECCGEGMQRVPCPSMVMTDIQPYQSMLTGEWISSRSRHREHLRDHNCIEVGNEKQQAPEKKPPPGLKDAVIRAFNEVTRGG